MFLYILEDTLGFEDQNKGTRQNSPAAALDYCSLPGLTLSERP